MTRRNRRPGRGSLLGSAALHLAVLAVAWSTSAFRPEPLFFETFRIELVSPPPATVAEEPTPAAPEEELVVDTPVETAPAPDPVPPPPEETREPEPEPEPEPDPRPDPPAPQPRPEPVETTPTPAAEPDPEPAETGGENINVRMEGLRKDYPAYYNNIVRQIQRCFRPPPGGNWETVVFFVINRDGSVSDTRFVKQSGNARFDFEALGAIADCAGRSGRFGPLPDDLPYDRLPIQFSFRPAGAGR